MSDPTAAHRCPAWCVRDHTAGPNPAQHLGVPVALAAPEAGPGECTARLASGLDGAGCSVLISRTVHTEACLPIEGVDLLLDALDDDGVASFQAAAQLLSQARSGARVADYR